MKTPDYDNLLVTPPLVSIVIPTYNRKHIISRAIDSVLNQTYDHFEILVVDDGSTDGTSEFLKNRYKKTIRVIFQENQGASAARNKGIESARGKFVAFLDSDDQWLHTKLETQISFLEENPSVALLCARTYRADNPSKVNTYLSEAITGDLFSTLYTHSFVSTPTVVVKKEVLEQVGGFDTRYVSAEDFDLWLKITRVYNCAFLPDYVAIVNRGGDNLSKDKITLHYHAISILKKYFDKNIIPINKYKKVISDSYIALGRNYFKTGEKSLARKNFLKSFAVFPFRLRSIRYFAKSFF